jgi:cytidylate kinase
VKKIITVDGPAGSGKERISKYIARKYKLYHLDSGILYRRLAYELSKNNIKDSEIYKIKEFIKNIKKLSLRKTQTLRNEQIGKTASQITKLDFVRYFINSQQRLSVKRPNKKKWICNRWKGYWLCCI